eukprot:scaffold671505_cov60-Prasinocladus_malaysianus.AAC.2
MARHYVHTCCSGATLTADAYNPLIYYCCMVLACGHVTSREFNLPYGRYGPTACRIYYNQPICLSKCMLTVVRPGVAQQTDDIAGKVAGRFSCRDIIVDRQT